MKEGYYIAVLSLVGGQGKQPCEATEETVGGVGGRSGPRQRVQAQAAA